MSIMIRVPFQLVFQMRRMDQELFFSVISDVFQYRISLRLFLFNPISPMPRGGRPIEELRVNASTHLQA
jgi:hypothetical protein